MTQILILHGLVHTDIRREPSFSKKNSLSKYEKEIYSNTHIKDEAIEFLSESNALENGRKLEEVNSAT